MAGIKTSILSADIEQVVQQIVEGFQPQKVILFGSYAYGVPTEDSDVDLLILMETEGSTLHAAARISAFVDHPFPLDILVFRPSYFQASLERNGVFVTEVATKGKILYEA